MPRIVPGDSLFAGFNPTSPLVLPKLFGPVWGGPNGVPDFAKSPFMKANYDQWADITGHIIGRTGILEGVPSWAISSMSTFFAKLPTVRPADVASLVIGAAAKAVSVSLAESCTAIPILGIAVELGLNVYSQVSTLINYAKSQKKAEQPPPGQALVFDYGDNEALAQSLMLAAQEADWTKLFLPPSTSGKWFAQHVSWVPGQPGQGWSFGTSADLGYGLMPGIAECLGTLTTVDGPINYQFANSTPGGLWGSDFDLPPRATAGELAPSSRQIAVLLWQQVMKNSVTMYKIDPFKIATAWLDYYEGFAEFALTLQSEKGVENAISHGPYGTVTGVGRTLNPNLAYNEALAASTYLGFVTEKGGGLKVLYPTSKPTASKPGYLPSLPKGVSLYDLATAGSLTYTPADIIRYNVHVHAQRSLACLRTLTVAYIPSDAPMLKASAPHAAQHHEMRAILLNRQAVDQVELDLIPDLTAADREFRAAVAQIQRIHGFQPKGIGFGIATPSKPGKNGKAPQVNDDEPEPDMPDSPAPALPSGKSKGSSGGSVLPVLGGAVAVAIPLALLLRRFRR